MAAGLGFEPRQTAPEAVVLPLHNPATSAKAIIARVSQGAQPAAAKILRRAQSGRAARLGGALNKDSCAPLDLEVAGVTLRFYGALKAAEPQGSGPLLMCAMASRRPMAV